MSEDNVESSGKKIDRRQMLQVASGSLLAGPLTIGNVTAENTVRIPIVKSGNEVVHSKEVPRGWWQYEKRVDKEQDRLARRYGGESGIRGVGKGITDEMFYDGRKKSSLVVYTDPSSDSTAEIPDHVDGIPVETATGEGIPRCYTGNYDPVPGGVGVGVDETSDDTDDVQSLASGTCPVQDSNGNNGYMTCAHMFYSDCTNPDFNDVLLQSGQDIGKVATWNIIKDYAVVTLENNAQVSGFENSIVDAYGSISGYVSYSGLQDLKSNGTTVHHRGRTSCKTDTTVVGTDVNFGPCTEQSSDYVHFSYSTQDGDSGGPFYHTFTSSGSQQLAIIAPTYGTFTDTSGNEYGMGCGAYAIHNQDGISFGIN